MMLAGRYSFSRTRHAATATDTEALQTDVMRFIAIIGLCLTAIFSLMRSITDPAENRHSSDNQALREQLNTLELQMAQQMAQQHRSTRVLEARLAASQTRLANANQQLRSLDQMRDRLSGLNQVLASKTQKQLQLEQLVEKSRQKTSHLKTRLKDLQQQAEITHRKPVRTVSADAQSPPTSTGEPARQGLVLKFASENTLSQLIQNDQVKLLGILDRQAWQLRLHEQQPVVQKIPMPGKYYEMLPETLPARYRQVFHAANGQSETTNILWAVQIPVSTEREVQRLLQTAQQGDLIIQVDASVVLKPGDDG